MTLYIQLLVFSVATSGEVHHSQAMEIVIGIPRHDTLGLPKPRSTLRGNKARAVVIVAEEVLFLMLVARR